MRHESNWNGKKVAAIVAVPALALVLAGCGGGEAPDARNDAAAGSSAMQGAPGPAEPEHVVTPRGTDEIYDEIVRALDSAYTDLGSPPSDFEHLSDVQARASKQLASAVFEWPAGTSYSLSVLDDRVTVYINCDGEEKRGDWAPGEGSERPS